MDKMKYFDNLLDAAIYSLDGIYEKEYIIKNYNSSTSKIRKIIKNLRDNDYIIRDNIIKKWKAKRYE